MTRYASTIRKAVIPAAGLGTRFLPYTKSQPKEMLPLLDKPTIQYVVEEAVESGIEKICIIDCRGKGAIRDHYGETPDRLLNRLKKRDKHDEVERLERLERIGDEIDFRRQRSPNGLGDAVTYAKSWVDDEPFALLLGDDVISSTIPCTKQLMQVYEKVRRPVIAIEQVEKEKISSYGIVDLGKKVRGIDRAHHIRRLVEKPQPEKAPSNMGIVGRYILEPSVFGYLERLKIGAGGEKQLTDALEWSLETGQKGIVAYQFDGRRIDTGTPFSWLTANIDMALADPEMGPRIKEFMTRKVA